MSRIIGLHSLCWWPVRAQLGEAGLQTVHYNFKKMPCTIYLFSLAVWRLPGKKVSRSETDTNRSASLETGDKPREARTGHERRAGASIMLFLIDALKGLKIIARSNAPGIKNVHIVRPERAQQM
jgi:hypothetical protein